MGKRRREQKALARAAAAGDSDAREPGRFSARRRTETILRMLRGEPLDSLARELGVTAATPGNGGNTFSRAATPR